MLFDQRTVRPVSFYQPDLGCCLSMPAVLGRKGVERPIPILLNEKEQKELEDCAKNLREVIAGAQKEFKKSD